MKPDELDMPEAGAAFSAGQSHVRWPLLLLSAAFVILGWLVVAVSIRSADPIGLLTPQAIGGLIVALIGFVVLTRLTPLRRWRTYAALTIVVVAMAASPPAWTIRALVAVSLWAALELGILLTRYRLRVQPF